ncbi:hypothetical protein JRQ81_014143 [Phrynocephalus forsythii]|uniref:Somatoliberin n=1 Tax=Phrynocephalus forsythii TaxID=171643 RepID=A0A9Q1B3D4_9SAUR|nr:hypothetical protein JRQ81_014143 [Phrynocephalus forsythii]
MQYRSTCASTAVAQVVITMKKSCPCIKAVGKKKYITEERKEEQANIIGLVVLGLVCLETPIIPRNICSNLIEQGHNRQALPSGCGEIALAFEKAGKALPSHKREDFERDTEQKEEEAAIQIVGVRSHVSDLLHSFKVNERNWLLIRTAYHFVSLWNGKDDSQYTDELENGTKEKAIVEDVLHECRLRNFRWYGPVPISGKAVSFQLQESGPVQSHNLSVEEQEEENFLTSPAEKRMQRHADAIFTDSYRKVRGKLSAQKLLQSIVGKRLGESTLGDEEHEFLTRRHSDSILMDSRYHQQMVLRNFLGAMLQNQRPQDIKGDHLEDFASVLTKLMEL